MFPIRIIVVVLAFAAVFVGPVMAADGERPKVATYAKVYKGPEGLGVAVLGVGDPANEEYLLQFSGINHDWNWKIFKVKRSRAGHDGYDYTITIGDKDWVALIERKPYGYSQIEAFVPDMGGGAKMSYDENLSQRVNSEHYLTDYLQQESGTKVQGAAWR
jgi:hypothetical protein